MLGFHLNRSAQYEFVIVFCYYLILQKRALRWGGSREPAATNAPNAALLLDLAHLAVALAVVLGSRTVEILETRSLVIRGLRVFKLVNVSREERFLQCIVVGAVLCLPKLSIHSQDFGED